MTSSGLILTVEGPFGLVPSNAPELFAHPRSTEAGAYLWVVPFAAGGFLVTYVGETGTSFRQRLAARDQVLWNGLWRRGTRDRVAEYLARLPDLAPTLQRLFAVTYVFIAPLTAPRDVRQRIETAIAQHIRDQPAPWSSLLSIDIRYRRSRKVPAVLPLRVCCTAQIHGLPEQLAA